MRDVIRCAVVALVAAAMVAAGCDEAPQEETADEETEQQPVDEEQQPVEEEEQEVDEPEFDEEMYTRAAFESRCVDQQIDDEQEAETIREEILARYGFTADDFEAASEHFSDDEEIQSRIETRMEECDQERARSFAEEGSGEMDGEDEEDEETDEASDRESDESGENNAETGQADPDPEPMATGTFETDVTAADLENTRLELRIRSDSNVGGEFRGERAGDDFLIPISGEVSGGDQLRAGGERGDHSVEIRGEVHPRGVEGEMNGEIGGDSFRVRYEVR